MPMPRRRERTKWTLPFPANRRIVDRPDEWVEQAFEANRNALVATARAIGMCERDLRAEVERRGMDLPVPDKLLGGPLRTLTAEEARRLYDANNQNLCDVAALFGVSRVTMRRALRRLGVDILRGLRRWSPSAEALRRAYWDEGKTAAQIGAEYGVSGHAVLVRMRNLGVPRRPRNPKWSEWPTEAAHRRIENAGRARWRKDRV